MSDEHIKLTAVSCRAARAILGWGVRDLAAKAGVGPDTISNYENGRPMRDSNRRTIQDVLEAEGVEILAAPDAGARLQFDGAWAQSLEGVWKVLVRWRDGDPLSGMLPATAREKAKAARERGDMRLAEALDSAADEAERNQAAKV